MTENRMELFIETLTGTAFELSCSPFETIVSIKAKIQYSEGIPVSQQHLIWKSQELNDDLCLQDYQITDGATLKLVLGMRGGPINTRQISDSKKLKDISDCVERRTDTSGSGGRPFTVLVFHDGDKVHMYTLMERGDCTISPVSGAVSDTSSVASSKHLEELDQELIRENEITKEKISQLQEQIRALNINRSKRFQPSPSQVKENITPPKNTNEKFHLPPIQRFGTSDYQTKQYLKSSEHYNLKKDEKKYFSEYPTDENGKLNMHNKLADINDELETEESEKYSLNAKDSRASSTLSGKMSLKTPQRSSLESANLFCSSFLPYIEPVPETSITKKPFRRLNSSDNQCIGFSLSSSCLNPITKYDFSKVKHNKQCPLTSSQVLSTRRFLDLDNWIQNRPRTSPEDSLSKHLLEDESLCRNKFVRENRVKQKLKRIRDPLSISLSSGEKASLLMEAYSNHTDIPYEISSLTSKGKPSFVHSHSKTDVGAFLNSLKALKEYSPCSTEIQENIPKQKNTKNSPKAIDDSSRPNSGRKLPLIKAKKKSYKRCSLCSKRTGLATSYTCRCGKNFCAPHRYAEVHQCSYDYKTEGRRLLQLNNPVVAASKLPKI